MKRRDNDQSLGEVIRHMIDLYRTDEKYRLMEIRLTWEEVLGKGVAERTERLYLREKTLVALMNSAVLREQLFYDKQQIILRINEELRYTAITDIDFR